MIHRHYLISGRVQGVGFRRFTEGEARALGLKGGVRNLRDGRVEVLASGTNESLEIFELALSRGPARSSVSQIDKHDVIGQELAVFRNLFGANSGADFVMYKDGESSWL